MSSNQTPPTSKGRVIKSLAIAGFIGIIIIIAWLAMQLVHVVPGAFASLASLAEGVRQYQGAVPSTAEPGTDDATETSDTIALTADTRSIEAGEVVTVRWSTTDTPGSYTFNYQCADGVAVDLEGVAGLTSISCNTNYNIGNVDSLTLRVDSEKERFAEVVYEIAFLRTNDTEPRARGSQTIAVVNESVSEFPNLVSTDPVVTEPVVAEPAVTSPTTPSTPSVNQPYQQEFVYAIPTSNPNGTTDLAVRFMNVGRIVNNNFSVSALTRNIAGAVQFEVKNTGTKTSRTWTYEARLPGTEYTSTEQVALKPNERAIITLGFPATTVRSHQFVVNVTDTSDRNVTNNRFVQAITIQ